MSTEKPDYALWSIRIDTKNRLVSDESYLTIFNDYMNGFWSETGDKKCNGIGLVPHEGSATSFTFGSKSKEEVEETAENIRKLFVRASIALSSVSATGDVEKEIKKRL